MPTVGCPGCGQLLADTANHCPTTSPGSCWWVVCPCGAVVNYLRPHLFIRHAPRSTP